MSFSAAVIAGSKSFIISVLFTQFRDNNRHIRSSSTHPASFSFPPTMPNSGSFINTMPKGRYTVSVSLRKTRLFRLSNALTISLIVSSDPYFEPFSLSVQVISNSEIKMRTESRPVKYSLARFVIISDPSSTPKGQSDSGQMCIKNLLTLSRSGFMNNKWTSTLHLVSAEIECPSSQISDNEAFVVLLPRSQHQFLRQYECRTHKV